MKRYYAITSIVIRIIYGGYAIINGFDAENIIIAASLWVGGRHHTALPVSTGEAAQSLVTMLGMFLVASGSMSLVTQSGFNAPWYFLIFLSTHFVIVLLMFRVDLDRREQDTPRRINRRWLREDPQEN